jgi:hypothetical protein
VRVRASACEEQRKKRKESVQCQNIKVCHPTTKHPGIAYNEKTINNNNVPINMAWLVLKNVCTNKEKQII